MKLDYSGDVSQGSFFKVSAFSLSGKTPNLKVEISKSFAFTISA